MLTINAIKYTKEFDPDKFFNTLSNAVHETTHLKCPVNCGALTSITEFKGISYCPSCLGVWFESKALKNMLNGHPNKIENTSAVDAGTATIGFFDILFSLIK